MSGRQFPADLILLASSEPKGMAYIETSNLDGETNLKLKQALTETASFTNDEEIVDLRTGFTFITQNKVFSKSPLFGIFQNRSNKGIFDRSSIETVIFRVLLWLKWSAMMILGLFSCFE